MAMPLLQELLKTLKTQGGSGLAEQLRAFPGGEQVLRLLGNGKETKLS